MMNSDMATQPDRLRLVDAQFAIDKLPQVFAKLERRADSRPMIAHYRIAGHEVRIRTFGEAFAQALAKALKHLRVEAPGAPALTIDLWDEAGCGSTSWPIWPEDADTFGTISLAQDDRYVVNQRPSSVMVLDRQANRIFGGIRGMGRLYQDERIRPLHRLISIWLDDRDIHFIHAALVSHRDNGLLLVGKSGSGKSTSSISCLFGDFVFLSDDYVALEQTSDDRFVGHSLYATCLIDNAERFPALARISHAPNYPFETKRAVYLDDLEGARFAAATEIRAILMPRIVDQAETTYRRARPIEAMLALAPSSLWILPGSAPTSLEKLKGLVSAAPAYRLELGRDYKIADAISRIGEELSGQP